MLNGWTTCSLQVNLDVGPPEGGTALVNLAPAFNVENVFEKQKRFQRAVEASIMVFTHKETSWKAKS